jgi:hypothetical protein
MNPGLRARIAAGEFARVVLDADTSFRGYIAADPADPAVFRMDGYVLGESGHLQALSLRLQEDDIHQIEFLLQAPVFVDAEGQDMEMARGFLPDG